MSSHFQWHFGDDLPEETSDEEQPASGPWDRWLIWGLMMILAAGGAYAWWRQRQVTLSQAETQVQQVARLELRALTQNDAELYLSLQDEANAAWGRAQEAYTRTKALPLPLQGATVSVDTAVRNARVVGDGARVHIEHTSVFSSGRRATFRATRFYRFTEQGRWVHTKADSAYGGSPVSLFGDGLEVGVLEEDAEWVKPMVSSLARLTSDFCDLASCQQGLPLVLDLGATLDEAAAREDLVLPAPFLVGAPADDAARAAWEAALRRFLLQRLIRREIGSRRAYVHRAEVLQDRLYVWFHGELGLSAPHAPDPEPVAEALDTEAWIPLWELWSVSPDDPRRSLAASEIDLLIAYIESEYGAWAVARLPGALRDAHHPAEAIADIVREPWRRFRRHYLAYVREVTARRSDRLTAFPSYDLMMTCWETLESTRLGGVWGLRLDESELTFLSAGYDPDDLMPVSWSPDGDRLLAVGDADERVAFHLLRAGDSAPQPLSTMPPGAEPVGSMLLSQSGWSPDGAYLAYRVPNRPLEGGILALETGDHVAFDGDFVAWSPDGFRLIYGQPIRWRWSPDVIFQTYSVWSRYGGDARQLGRGYAATWSPDGTRVAYVSHEPALKSYNLATGEMMTLLDEPSLQEAFHLTPTVSSVSGRSFDVAWSPTGEWIALGATRSGKAGAAETLTMLVGKGSYHVLAAGVGGLSDLSWSPDGRWLTTLTFAEGEFNSVVSNVEGESLFDGEAALVSWSPGGRHLVVAQGSLPLRVLEVASGEWHTVEVPGVCWPLMWNPGAAHGELTKAPRGLLSMGHEESSIQAGLLSRFRP